MNIPYLQQEDFLIEMLVNQKCNYTCRHCMYNCSPNETDDYMSNEVLGKIYNQIEFCKKLDIKPRIEISGGEPTLDWNEFVRILGTVVSWETHLSISTNGWWIESKKDTKIFFDLLDAYEHQYNWLFGPYKNFLYVRISDDPYHKEQRNIKDIDLWLYDNSHPSYMSKQNWEGKSLKTGKGEFYYVSPNGRGRNCKDCGERFGNLEKYFEFCGAEYRGTFCTRGFDRSGNSKESVHYDRNGLSVDGCGFGSMYDFGTVNDNILYLRQLMRQYKYDREFFGKKYNCYNCNGLTKQWKESKVEMYRDYFSSMNTFDVEEFLIANKNVGF